MREKTTDKLNNLLINTDVRDFETFYENNKEFMKESDRPFYDYFKAVLSEKNIRLKDVYIRADVSESYGGKIIRMENKHTANRDLIIKLCMAGHFDWKQTNRALKLYGFCELYAKVPRDALIMMSINGRKFDIEELNERLAQNDFERLRSGEQERL